MILEDKIAADGLYAVIRRILYKGDNFGFQSDLIKPRKPTDRHLVARLPTHHD
jgi:hypothetical protein